MKKIALALMLSLLSACAPATSGGRAPLNLPNPEPLKMRPVSWQVVPRDDRGTDPDVVKHSILFGLSEAGYKSLAENMQEIINFIGLQRRVIDSYKKYYEQDHR